MSWEDLFASNIVQLMLTAFAGGLLVLTRYQSVLIAAAWVMTLGLLFSLFFQIGEVYFYSDFYARAFFFYGDQITTLVAFSYLLAIANKKHWLAVIAFTALLTSGGKIAFVLFFIMMLLYVIVHKQHFRNQCQSFCIHAGIAAALYFCLLSASQGLERLDFYADWKDRVNHAMSYAGLITPQETNHRGACPKLSTCLETQVERPLMQRYYSAIAGLWMTMQGGYAGSRYPNTNEKFADLLMQENPWQINQRYGLTWLDWKKIGQVQNAYLSFSSGYGPWLLAILLLVLFAIAGIALSNLNAGEKGLASVFSIFYLVNVLFNQTQSWLKSGSPILLTMGFCAASILLLWAARHDLLPRRLRPLLPLASKND